MIDMQTGEGLGILENALSHLQCIFIARRARDTPEMLSWAQYDILEILRLRGPMTPSFLGGRLGGARTGISKTLRVLKDLKLVEQMPGEGDRREQITVLTQQGRDYLECVATFRRDAAQCVMKALTLNEQVMFTNLCDKVSAALSGHNTTCS